MRTKTDEKQTPNGSGSDKQARDPQWPFIVCSKFFPHLIMFLFYFDPPKYLLLYI